MNETKNPTQWLTTILEEAKGFDGTMFPPTEKLEEGDTVISECPESLRPFWAYMRYCERETKQAKVEMEFTSNEDDKAALLGKAVDMASRKQVLAFVFWSCMNEFLATWSDTCHLGLRADWKVVRHECNHTDGPQELIRRLFGG